MPSFMDNADEADKAKARWADKAIFMTIVATDAIYIAETEDTTNLLDKTANDAAEANKADIVNKTVDAADAAEVYADKVDMVEKTDALDNSDESEKS